MTTHHHRTLMPAPPRQAAPPPAEPPAPPPDTGKTFFDLPAELRVEIYKIALSTVTIHILPPGTNTDFQSPHSLVRTSRQVRNEVLPIIHNSCTIEAAVTDFNFNGLIEWMKRMPPDQESNLCKNRSLQIRLHTTLLHDRKREPPVWRTNVASLRTWLRRRADVYRPQPTWTYSGPVPDAKTAAELRRRASRMKAGGEKTEFVAVLAAIGVRLRETETE